MDSHPARDVDVSTVSEVPVYWQKLLDPDIKTIFITGCGGGFDFVHSMTVIPVLINHGKRVVIGSNSFGLPEHNKNGKLYWSDHNTKRTRASASAYLVDASCEGPAYYCPEVALCKFLDDLYPDKAPHSVYAYYARAMSIPLMRSLYEAIVDEHEVDAIVTMDGGSDSLMAGNETGLGDPLEDATSLAAISLVANPRVRARILICIGVGCDRFNGISDSATFRAIAELTRAGAFCGSASLSSSVVSLYQRVIEYMGTVMSFDSVIANAIVASGGGAVGSAVVPRALERRVRPGQLYLWPLMAMHFAFDVQGVVNRSLLIPHLTVCQTHEDQERALYTFRARIEDSIVTEEELPRADD